MPEGCLKRLSAMVANQDRRLEVVVLGARGLGSSAYGPGRRKVELSESINNNIY